MYQNLYKIFDIEAIDMRQCINGDRGVLVCLQYCNSVLVSDKVTCKLYRLRTRACWICKKNNHAYCSEYNSCLFFLNEYDLYTNHYHKLSQCCYVHCNQVFAKPRTCKSCIKSVYMGKRWGGSRSVVNCHFWRYRERVGLINFSDN